MSEEFKILTACIQGVLSLPENNVLSLNHNGNCNDVEYGLYLQHCRFKTMLDDSEEKIRDLQERATKEENIHLSSGIAA